MLASFNYVLRFGKWAFYLRALRVQAIPVVDNFPDLLVRLRPHRHTG